MKTIIGQAVVKFDKEGRLYSVDYKSKIKAEVSRLELESQLSVLTPASEEEIVKASQLAMAKWFNSVNEVELFDRTLSTLETEIDKCIKVNGKIEECYINFYITPLN